MQTGNPQAPLPRSASFFLMADPLFQNVKLIQLAVSLGGVQSLIEVAGAMTHPEKYISSSERQEGGLKESLIRFR